MKLVLLICALVGYIACLMARLFFNVPVWAPIYIGVASGVIFLMLVVFLLPDSWLDGKTKNK